MEGAVANESVDAPATINAVDRMIDTRISASESKTEDRFTQMMQHNAATLTAMTAAMTASISESIKKVSETATAQIATAVDRIIADHNKKYEENKAAIAEVRDEMEQTKQGCANTVQKIEKIEEQVENFQTLI